VRKTFAYDIFLSHNAKDKPAVRELAERLKQDGLRVWFDEWVIQPGDLISLKIEKGLEQSRTLILVMSHNAFASDWVTLERHTVLFRDPTNAERRFIPLRLDDAEITDTLKQFAYIDWRLKAQEQYTQWAVGPRFDACGSPAISETACRRPMRSWWADGQSREYRAVSPRAWFCGVSGDQCLHWGWLSGTARDHSALHPLEGYCLDIVATHLQGA
jgi:hypothetical protein